MATTSLAMRMSASAICPSGPSVVLFEARLDHHVLASSGPKPSTNAPRRASATARLRFTWRRCWKCRKWPDRLVHEIRPERRRVQVAQVLLSRSTGQHGSTSVR